MFRTILTAIALTVSTAAAAHTFWLQPVDHTSVKGEEVLVEFKVGDLGEEAADWGIYWERIASFRMFGPRGVIDQQPAIRITGSDDAGSARVRVPGEGSYILAFESNPSFSDLEAERFNRYLENEGLGAIAAHRVASGTTGVAGTELYARRAKTLLQVGDARTSNVTRPIGQTLEIVPLQNPFDLKEGGVLDLQVLWRGLPLQNAKVHVAPLDGSRPVEDAITSADGVVRVSAPRGEAMLYSVTWGVPAPNDARADYFTIFASLTVATL